MHAQSLSRVWLFATPWTIAHQAPLSMVFPKQKYWSGLPFPTPGDHLNPGIKPVSLASPAFAGGFFTTEPPGKPSVACSVLNKYLLNKWLWSGSVAVSSKVLPTWFQPQVLHLPRVLPGYHVSSSDSHWVLLPWGPLPGQNTKCVFISEAVAKESMIAWCQK